MKLNWLTKHFYRKKTMGIVADGKGNYLVDQLTDYGDDDWNFPGGGILNDETEEDGLLRELKEELGTDKFTILSKADDLNTYKWPLKLVVKRALKNKGLFIGQSVRIFIVVFNGKKSDIKIDPGEIRKIKWIKRNEFKKYLRFKNQINTVENALNQLK